ncbi:peroxisomal membrane protein [Salix suchowensis]|nr:peroxisomal membrane protein [Salix suchowensis]
MSVSLLDFVQTVPQPLTSALIQLSPQIHFGRNALEIVSWNNTLDSCLVLAGWWFVCTFYYSVCVFLLPLLLLVYAILLVQRRSTNAASVGHPTTEDSLQVVITDLSVIQSLIPTLSLPSNPNSDASSRRESGGSDANTSATVHSLYTLRCRDPHRPNKYPCRHLRFSLHHTPLKMVLRSSFDIMEKRVYPLRCLPLWRLRHGQHFNTLVPILCLSNLDDKPQGPRRTTHSIPPLSFHHSRNQRWWMGLDWTAALLPSERPSWSTTSLLPIAPPASFSLPEDTISVIELPKNGGKGSGTKGKKRVLKRTAKWRWDEAEWKVLVRREDKDDKVERVECPLPVVKEEMEQQSQIATSSSLNSIVSASNASGSATTKYRQRLFRRREHEFEFAKHRFALQNGDLPFVSHEVTNPFLFSSGTLYTTAAIRAI